jgi:PEGA domain
MSLSRLLGFALALLTFVATLAASRDARCDPAGPRAYPLYVLAVDTDDADDQSEALTGALRSRVRGASGWSLSETTLTLSMLTAALKCPKIPDPACLVKIGDQLKADRFVWGTMQKVPGNMVKVDLHLWARGKPDVTAGDSYTDNLKDQNDERLQRIAQRLFDRLTGSTSSGSLVVHAGDGGGIVMVDGQRRGSLEKGDATIELPSGTHAVEVRVQGYAWAKESVTITAGKEARLNVTLVAEGAPPSEPPSAGPSARKVAGWAAVGVGAALLIAGGVEAIVYLGKKSDQDNVDRTLFGGNDVCNPILPDPKDPRYPQAKQVTSAACSRSQDAKNVSTLGIIFGAAGAVATTVGLYLVLTDGGSSPTEKAGPKFEDRAAKATGPTMRLVPEISPRGQGLLLQGTF